MKRKKVLILQSKGRQVGGVWFVNKTLAEGLADLNYEVEVISIRDNPTDYIPPHSEKIKVFTINEKDLWETTKKRDILNACLKGNLFKVFKLLLKKIEDNWKLNNDYKKLGKYILNFKPDIIINSHYELIKAIPNKYLRVTINEIHTSFDRVYKECWDAIKTLKKYKNKIGKMVWLTSATCQDAISKGFDNSTYIYNPIRFQEPEISNVSENKTLITMCRLSSKEKRLDLMVDIVSEVLSDPSFENWKFEIYGPGVPTKEVISVIDKNPKIELKGNIEMPQTALKNSSIYLSTSPYEGLALSILEAMECGIPTVAYHFGESTEEEIIDHKTGLIIPFGNREKFIQELKNLMLDEVTLKKMSENCKEYAKTFSLDNILKQWIKLFNEIEKGD